MFGASFLPSSRDVTGGSASVVRRSELLGRAPRWGALGDAQAVEQAADGLARGAVVAHGFGQFYVLMTRPDASTVGKMNLWKGRPVDQVGSICSSPLLIESLFDWQQVSPKIDKTKLLALMDALMALGPFGFRGPAAEDIPTHLSSIDGDCRTTQVIVPGYRCPSQALITESMRRIGSRYLYVTSTNQSHHMTGAAEEPAHWRAAPLARDFAHVDELWVLEHESDERARSMHPDHLPMSTSIISFHRELADVMKPTLRLERHGSMHVEQVAELLQDFGFDLQVDLRASVRLPCRSYDETRQSRAAGGVR